MLPRLARRAFSSSASPAASELVKITLAKPNGVVVVTLNQPAQVTTSIQSVVLNYRVCVAVFR